MWQVIPPNAQDETGEGVDLAWEASQRTLRSVGGAVLWLGAAAGAELMALNWWTNGEAYAEIWPSVGLIASGAYWLGGRGYSPRRVAWFGLLSGLVFLPRAMLGLSHTISDLGLLVWLVTAILLAGFAALTAAWRQAIVACLAWQEQQRQRARPVENAEGVSAEKLIADESRLGIAHLMGWTAFIACWLGVAAGATNDPMYGSRTQFLSTWYSLSGGAAMLGLAVFVARHKRAAIFPTRPGEFLWVAIGAGSAVWLVTLIAADLQTSLADPVRAFTLIESGTHATQAVEALALLVALRCLPTVRWRFFFGAAIAEEVGSLLMSSNGSFGDLPIPILLRVVFAVVPGVLLMLCLVVDQRHRIAYSWSHWAGVVVWIFWTISHWWIIIPLGLSLLPRPGLRATPPTRPVETGP